MDDGNFDEQGRQKKDLATLRQELGAEMAS
jgi:hypothetical protein